MLNLVFRICRFVKLLVLDLDTCALAFVWFSLARFLRFLRFCLMSVIMNDTE